MAPEAYFQLKIRRQGGRGWPVIAAATRLWVARVPLARAWGSTLSGEPLGWRPKRRAVACICAKMDVMRAERNDREFIVSRSRAYCLAISFNSPSGFDIGGDVCSRGGSAISGSSKSGLLCPTDGVSFGDYGPDGCVF